MGFRFVSGLFQWFAAWLKTGARLLPWHLARLTLIDSSARIGVRALMFDLFHFLRLTLSIITHYLSIRFQLVFISLGLTEVRLEIKLTFLILKRSREDIRWSLRFSHFTIGWSVSMQKCFWALLPQRDVQLHSRHEIIHHFLFLLRDFTPWLFIRSVHDFGWLQAHSIWGRLLKFCYRFCQQWLRLARYYWLTLGMRLFHEKGFIILAIEIEDVHVFLRHFSCQVQSVIIVSWTCISWTAIDFTIFPDPEQTHTHIRIHSLFLLLILANVTVNAFGKSHSAFSRDISVCFAFRERTWVEQGLVGHYFCKYFLTDW